MEVAKGSTPPVVGDGGSGGEMHIGVISSCQSDTIEPALLHPTLKA
jgi:hypothetical protein